MKKSALIYIAVACTGWGMSGVFVNFLSPWGFTSLQMTFIRSITMFLCMLAYAIVKDRKLFEIPLTGLILTIGSGLSFFGTASCYFFAMVESSVSTAVVLMYTAPIFVMIYSVVFLGERLTKVKTLCVVLMLLGCGLVSGIIGGFSFAPKGILFGLISGLCYSSYNIFTKIQMKKGLNPVTVNLYGFLFATLAGGIIGDVTQIPLMVAQEPPLLLPLVILLGIVTAVVPYLTYSVALKHIPAGTASSLSILEPMMATVISVAFLNEHIGIFSAFGIIAILTAVSVLAKSEE